MEPVPPPLSQNAAPGAGQAAGHGDAPAPMRHAAIRGAAIAIALAWSMRLIGLVSVFVLARLLSPDDFGVIAMAAAMMALVDIFTNIGLYQALLRKPEPTRADYDTAWTIRLILMTILGMVLAASAPFAAAFFDQPALIMLIPFIAVQFVFTGLANIGIVEFDRHMQFGRDLKMRLSVRVITLVLTILAAVTLRSYWALAIGMVVQSAVHMLASYVFHPYRPRLSLAQRRSLVSFSLWMFAGYAAQALHHQAERIAVGRIAPAPVVGLYSVSKDLAAIFTLEIATALNRVTFVATARDDRPFDQQGERLQMMIGAYAMIVAPIGLGLAVVAPDALAVLLGAQWIAAAPLIAVIAPSSAVYAVHKLVASTMQASGRPAKAAALSGSGAAAIMLAVGIAAATGADAQRIAAISMAVNTGVLLAGITALARLSQTAASGILAAFARPFLAAIGMAAVVHHAGIATGFALANLAINGALGAAAYAALLALVWRASGTPQGAEQQLWAMLTERLARPAARASD